VTDVFSLELAIYFILPPVVFCASAYVCGGVLRLLSHEDKSRAGRAERRSGIAGTCRMFVARLLHPAYGRQGRDEHYVRPLCSLAAIRVL
jgi:hypothetical protein